MNRKENNTTDYRDHNHLKTTTKNPNKLIKQKYRSIETKIHLFTKMHNVGFGNLLEYCKSISEKVKWQNKLTL